MNQPPATHINVTVAPQPDPTWRDLYRAGALAALLATVCYLVALAVTISIPPPPTTGGAAMLDYIATYRTAYLLEQILWLVPGVPLMVTFLALGVALKEVNKSYAAIATVLGIASWAVTLAYPATGAGAPALIALSDHYAAATDGANRAALAAAAEGFIALNIVPTAIGVLEAGGVLVVALLMTRGLFPRGVAYLGIAVGAIGIGVEAVHLGPGYLVYGPLLFAWFIAVGWALLSLGRAGTNQRMVGTGAPVPQASTGDARP